jgi:drug/metabolite transporter (DMT)-like permease
MSSAAPPSRSIAFLALVATMAMWGSNGPVAKMLLPTFGPISMTWLRWFLVMVLAAPFAWRERVAVRAVAREHWRSIVVFTLLGGVPQSVIVFVGLDHSSAIHLGLLNSAIPVMILVLGALFFGHRMLGREIAGITISAFGVTVILFQGSLAALLMLDIGRGDLIMLSGMLLWSFYTLRLNHRPTQVSIVTFLFLVAAAGLPITLPLFVRDLLVHGLPRPDMADIAGLVYMSAVPTIISTFTYAFAIERVGPAQAGVFIHTVPLFACLFAAVLAGEALHPYHAAGFLLVAGGAWISCQRPAPVLSSAPATAK